MAHEPTDDELHDYVRGTLPLARMQELDLRFERDEAFRDRVADVASVEAALGDLADQTPPRSAWTRGLEDVASSLGLATRDLRRGLAVVAVAALALLVVAPGSRQTVPGYDVELRVGEHTLRGDDTPVDTVVTTGSQLVLTLRPDTRTEAALAGELFVDGERVLRAPASASGAVRLEGTFGTSLPALSDGAHTLEVRLVEEGFAGRVLEQRSWTIRWSSSL
jgi:hypothetical protein